MTTIVERNDVDISRLFVWGKELEIFGQDGEVQAKIYLRLLGDADVNRARVYALRKSRELRLKLLDPSSDERLIFLQTQDEMTEEELINTIAVFSMREITNRAYQEVKIDRPKMPKSKASLKKMEQFQKELDDFPAKFETAVKNFIKKEVDKLRKALSTESKETLYKRYVEELIDEFCEQEALRAYRDMEIFLGCYKDADYSDRAFENFEKFDNLPAEIKTQLRTAYDSISISSDELKKLREATQ